jgi:hypothetical protein
MEACSVLDEPLDPGDIAVKLCRYAEETSADQIRKASR